jgi:hypothetical protein
MVRCRAEESLAAPWILESTEGLRKPSGPGDSRLTRTNARKPLEERNVGSHRKGELAQQLEIQLSRGLADELPVNCRFSV